MLNSSSLSYLLSCLFATQVAQRATSVATRPDGRVVVMLEFDAESGSMVQSAWDELVLNAQRGETERAELFLASTKRQLHNAGISAITRIAPMVSITLVFVALAFG